MIARLGLPLLVLGTLAVPTTAQEKYWVAASGGVAQMDPSGFTWQTVPPSSSRDVAVAPDGKVWMVASGLTVLNADGTPFTTIAPSAGLSPYSIAFDKLGHAWVSGGSIVEEFDANGVSLGTIPMPSGSPLGICVDADGNKWIAHRIGPPGTLTRIDGITRAVSSHPLPATSLILPITPYADARGLFNSSHIWVVGDNRGAGELVEFDANGTVLNTITLGLSARVQWMSGDCDLNGITRNMWVGDWSSGNLYKVDVATGLFSTFTMGTGVGGVTFDGFGNLWVTLRGTGLVRRVDQLTGATEIEALVGASNQISTRWQYATVVDPIGDLDGDGTLNMFEASGPSSPFDACSLPNASLSVQGSLHLGNNMTLAVQADPSALTLVSLAGRTISPAIVFPGYGCALELDPAAILATFVFIGPGGITVPIPNTPGLVGYRVRAQGLNFGALTFTNLAPIMLY